MARPKQQHYVTRAYLEGFLRPSSRQLHCYGRSRGPFARSPEDLASQRNYYALRRDDGSWDDSLEMLLGEAVESPGLPVLQKLASGKTRLTWLERERLALLMAFQETRTPAAREKARELSKLLNDRIISEVRSGNPEQKSIKLWGESGVLDVTLEQMIKDQEVLCDDHVMEIHRMMAGAALKLAKVYKHMKFTVLFPIGEEEFITSDTPVIRVFPGGPSVGAGLDRPNVEVRFPLSRRAFLILTHDVAFAEKLIKATAGQRERLLAALPEVRVRQVSDDEVIALNKGQARHAHRWIYTTAEVGWAASLLAQPLVAPKVIDLSGGDLMHFQSRVIYDPRMDYVGK